MGRLVDAQQTCSRLNLFQDAVAGVFTHAINRGYTAGTLHRDSLPLTLLGRALSQLAGVTGLVPQSMATNPALRRGVDESPVTK